MDLRFLHWQFIAPGEQMGLFCWQRERESVSERVVARTPAEAARMQLCEVRRHAGCLTSQAPVARRKESSVKRHQKVTNNKRIRRFSAFAIYYVRPLSLFPWSTRTARGRGPGRARLIKK